jgi:hypothetical protein
MKKVFARLFQKAAGVQGAAPRKNRREAAKNLKSSPPKPQKTTAHIPHRIISDGFAPIRQTE